MKLEDKYRIQNVVGQLLPDGTIGHIYDDWAEFKQNHPNDSYKFGFVIVNEHNYIPDGCSDWNDSMEDVIKEYYEIIRKYKKENYCNSKINYKELKI